MFERYTEKARRAIFFARYEASQFGSPYIETEHLLLGLLREDKGITARFLCSRSSIESVRRQVEKHTTIREKVSTSVDLPLSNECKRVLAYAAEEAERLNHKHLGTEHLLLGILREEKCFASEMLKERKIELAQVREEVAKAPPEPPVERSPAAPVAPAESARDLSQLAVDDKLEPVVARDREIQSVIEVLSCRQRNSALLVGERGVGKTAILEGLASRIANGAAAASLAEKRLLSIEPAQVAAWVKGPHNLAFVAASGKADGETSSTLLVLDDLKDILDAAAKSGAVNAVEMLRHTMLRAEIQCLAACTPDEYRELSESVPRLIECFRPIPVQPLNADAALEILRARKVRLEQFHEVTYTDDALEAAVNSAGSYLPASPLPGKALELLDAAGAHVKLRKSAPPEEVAECQKKIRFIAHRLESAVANHEFEKARFYSEEEKKERANLRALQERYNLEGSAPTVDRKDIEETIARWSGQPLAP